MAGACCLTFAHLFSFQVSYADLPSASTLPSAGGTKMLMDAASLAMGFVKKNFGGGDNHADDIVLKRGIFEVDFTTGSLTLADKDKAIVVQEFQALKRKFAGDGDLFVSLHFQGNECWDITTQSRAEKTTLNHLLECILRKFSLDQTIAAGKDKELIGIDKTIIKAGLLNRKAKTVYKVDERFIVLVPGKLLLFKGPDLSSKRVRYATTLARARVEATHGQPSFQLLVPNTKALALAASSAEAAKEWILALEDSIEYANTQGVGVQSKQATRETTQGRTHRDDGGYMIPDCNRLQNLHLGERTTAHVNDLPYYSQPSSDQRYGDWQQIYMSKEPCNQEYRGADMYADAQIYEKDDGYMRSNPQLVGKSFQTNQAGAPDYRAPFPVSGLLSGPRNVESPYGSSPFNAFATAQNTSHSGFAPSLDRYQMQNASVPMSGGMGGDYCSNGGLYPEIAHQNPNPNFCVDFHQQRFPSAHPNTEYADARRQLDCSREPYERLRMDHPNPYSHLLDGIPGQNFNVSPKNANYDAYGNPNANYGAFDGNASMFMKGGPKPNDRCFNNILQGNYASSTSHQLHGSTQASNRNNTPYDPWAAKMDMKDSDSDRPISFNSL